MSKFKSALDDQIKGDHYKNFKIQPIVFITENQLDWYQGSVIKYICRHQHKGEQEDVRKVIHYCQMLLESKYGIKSKIEYNDDDKSKSTPSKRVHRLRRAPRPRVQGVPRKLATDSNTTAVDLPVEASDPT